MCNLFSCVFVFCLICAIQHKTEASERMGPDSSDVEKEQKLVKILEEDVSSDHDHVQLLQRGAKKKNPSTVAPQAAASERMATDSCDAEKDQNLTKILEEEELASDHDHVELLQKAAKSKTPSAVVPQAAVLAGDGKAVAASKEHEHEMSILSKDSASSSVAKAGVSSQEALKDETMSGLISMDHNGNLCMFCSKPLPQRVDKVYTEFRTDCGSHSSPTGPSKSDIMKPIVQLLKEVDSTRQSTTNGFCEFNFAKSCADAIANKDYSYWSKTLDLKHPSLQEVADWNGRYCQLNGFLSNDVKSLQHNFDGMKAKARQFCNTKSLNYSIEKMSFLDVAGLTNYSALPTLEEAEILAAWSCGMGDVGCDMAMCAYSFCEDINGTVGLYDECQGWHPVHGMPF